MSSRVSEVRRRKLRQPSTKLHLLINNRHCLSNELGNLRENPPTLARPQKLLTTTPRPKVCEGPNDEQLN